MAQPSESEYLDHLIRTVPWLALFASARYIAVLYDEKGRPLEVVNRHIHRLDYIIDTYMRWTLADLYRLPDHETLDDFFSSPDLAWMRQGINHVPPEEVRTDRLMLRLFPTFQSRNKREGLAFYGQIYTVYPFSQITLFKLDSVHFLGVVTFKEFFQSDYFKGIAALTDTSLRLTMFGRGFGPLLGRESPEQALNRPISDFLVLTGPLQGIPESLPKPAFKTFLSWKAGQAESPFQPAHGNPAPARGSEGLCFENPSQEQPSFYRAAARLDFASSHFELCFGFQTPDNRIPNILMGGTAMSGQEEKEDLDALRVFSDHPGAAVVKTVTDKLALFRHPDLDPGKWHELEIRRVYHALDIRLDGLSLGECHYDWSFGSLEDSELSLFLRPGERLFLRAFECRLAPMQTGLEVARKLSVMASPRRVRPQAFFKVHTMPLFLDSDQANAILWSFENVTHLQADIEHLREDKEKLTRLISGKSSFIGVSPAMLEIRSLMGKVAGSDVSVLIEGETGTGKEVLAQALHQESGRRDQPFVKIDCATIPENLMESELFGHEKGAFTGATESHAGRFEQAQGGTIFLDEISNLSLRVQAKLLSVLQDLQIRRVGGTTPVALDVRVISASNIPLLDLVRRGLFREDLYYRLNQFLFALPPLRERPEDIALLAGHFAEEACLVNGKKPLAVSPAAMKALLKSEWPGNVRELRNTLYRAVLMSEKGEIRKEDVEPVSAASFPAKAAPAAVSRPKRWRLPAEELRALLERHHGNVTALAASLGVARLTVYQWIKRHGIDLEKLR